MLGLSQARNEIQDLASWTIALPTQPPPQLSILVSQPSWMGLSPVLAQITA